MREIIVYLKSSGSAAALCDSGGAVITNEKYYPVIHYGERAELKLRPLKDEGEPFSEAELSYGSYEFGVDNDWSHATAPAILVNSGFSVSQETIDDVTYGQVCFAISGNTEKVETLLDGNEKLKVMSEFNAFPSGESYPAMTLQFPFVLRNRLLDTGSVGPDEPVNNYYTIAETEGLLSGKEDSANKGVANGYAELDASGKVPSSQLPAYVDDVLEYADYASLPATGETGVIYVTLDDNKTYRWSGSVYVEISSSLALGETSDTAYRGDYGATAYAHSQLAGGNPHSVAAADLSLGNVDNTSDADKPVSTAQQTALDGKEDTVTNNAVADGTAAGQLKIWDATAGTWDNATLTAGSNINVTNNDGSITVAVTGLGGGDMYKSTYDTNDDGTVDSADTATTAGTADLAIALRKAATELTISSGAVTKTGLSHTIDGESDLDDDLDTISGGTDGDYLGIYPANAARNITLKHGTGNIVTGDGSDYTIPDNGFVWMYYDGSNWRIVGGSGSGGASAFTDLSDTPSSYSGSGGYSVKVNSGATALEFVADETTAYTTSFTDGDLTAGVLTVTHSLGQQTGLAVVVSDNNNKIIIPDDVTFSSTSALALDLSSYGALTGTWNVGIIKSGGSGSGGSLTNPMTTAGDIIYGGASGTPARLAAGTAAQVLAMNSGATAPEWVDASSGGSTILENWFASWGANAFPQDINTTLWTNVSAFPPVNYDDFNFPVFDVAYNAAEGLGVFFIEIPTGTTNLLTKILAYPETPGATGSNMEWEIDFCIYRAGSAEGTITNYTLGATAFNGTGDTESNYSVALSSLTDGTLTAAAGDMLSIVIYPNTTDASSPKQCDWQVRNVRFEVS